jgi:RNA 2',3'-cyclic 3'-phosphodiesterase
VRFDRTGRSRDRDFRRPEDDPPGTSRLFIAVPVPEDVRDGIAGIMHAVADGGDIDVRSFGQPRWVRIEGLHITLRFLGATPDERRPQVAEALARAAAQTERFELGLGGGGAFPNAWRPRVLWVGILDGATELRALAARVGEELAAAGWPIEDKPFAAHLTLARTDGVPGAAEAAKRLTDAARDVRLTWRADRIVLYKSLLGHGPAHYEELAAADLA